MKIKHEWKLICEAMMRLKKVAANKVLSGTIGVLDPLDIETELRRTYRLSRRKAMAEAKGPKR